MAEDFNVGDVVKLKSGGPEMTVEEIDQNDVVKCSWFEKSKQMTGTFKKLALEKSENKSEGFGIISG